MKDHSKYDKTDKIELKSLNNSISSTCVFNIGAEYFYGFLKDVSNCTNHNNDSTNVEIDKLDMSNNDKSDIVRKIICKQMKHDHCRIFYEY